MRCGKRNESSNFHSGIPLTTCRSIDGVRHGHEKSAPTKWKVKSLSTQMNAEAKLPFISHRMHFHLEWPIFCRNRNKKKWQKLLWVGISCNLHVTDAIREHSEHSQSASQRTINLYVRKWLQSAHAISAAFNSFYAIWIDCSRHQRQPETHRVRLIWLIETRDPFDDSIQKCAVIHG